MRCRLRAWACLGVTVLLLGGVLPGCKSKPTPPALVDVKGKLVHQNKGVGLVVLSFYGADGKGEGPFQGTTEKDGSFTLRCPRGDYKVTVTPIPVGVGQGPGAGGLEAAPGGNVKAVPEMYRNLKSTPLRATVPDKGTDNLALELP